MHQNIKNFINLINIGKAPDEERKTLVCAYLCLRSASSVSAAGARERGGVPSVLKAFLVSAAACCAVCPQSIRKKSKSAGLTGKKAQKKKNTLKSFLVGNVSS